MRDEKAFCIIGLVLSILLIGFGIKTIVYTPDLSSSYESVPYRAFGGDFYTDEYKATKAASYNVMTLSKNIEIISKNIFFHIGSLYIISGVFLMFYYSKNLGKAIAAKDGNNTNVTATQDTQTEKNEISIEMAEKEIEKYVILFDKGLISEKEFNEKREEILKRVSVM